MSHIDCLDFEKVEDNVGSLYDDDEEVILPLIQKIIFTFLREVIVAKNKACEEEIDVEGQTYKKMKLFEPWVILVDHESLHSITASIPRRLLILSLQLILHIDVSLLFSIIIIFLFAVPRAWGLHNMIIKLVVVLSVIRGTSRLFTSGSLANTPRFRTLQVLNECLLFCSGPKIRLLC